MQQSQSPTLEPQKQSEKIGQRIEEARAEIAAREAELAKIPPSKATILGGIDIDQTALDALEEQEFRLSRQIENFRTRIALLETQKEEAERNEAAERLQEIVALGERTVEAREPALAAYDAAKQALIEAAKVIANLYRQDAELMNEMVYWVDRFALPRPTLPRLGERPDLVGDLTREIGGAFSSLSITRSDSPWARKRQELASHPELRQRPQETSKPAQANTPTAARETVSIPVKPTHEEDRKPNMLQSLLGTRH
jgi:hypothetical protein